MVNCAHVERYIVLARDPAPSDEGQVECDFEAAAGRELEKLRENAKLGGVKDVRATVHGHMELTDRVSNSSDDPLGQRRWTSPKVCSGKGVPS